MKLIIATLPDPCDEMVSKALISSAHKVTTIASTSGWLRKGMTTLLVGAEDKKVEKAPAPSIVIDAAKTGEPVYQDIEKTWDEISFVKQGETEVERMNRTFLYEKDKAKRKLILMKDKLHDMYEYRYPIQRRVMEERLAFLDTEFQKFDYMINPYHVQPGILLDVDITSIKRKKATLNGMAGVLNEFLHGVSQGFQDAAFASFSRRRSTVREDIAQSFAAPTEEGPKSAEGDYVGMLNQPAAPAVSEGVVDASPKAPRKAGKKETRRGRGRAADGLAEI